MTSNKEVLLLINTSFNDQIYHKCLTYLQLLLNFAILTTLVNLVNIVSTTNKDIQVTMQNSPTSGLKLTGTEWCVIRVDQQERRMLEWETKAPRPFFLLSKTGPTYQLTISWVAPKEALGIPWLSKCIYFPGTETHTRVKELHYCAQKYSHQEPKCLAGA